MTKQETRGKVKHAAGKVKEAVGIVTGNSELEREGAWQRIEGTVQENLGKARREIGEFADGVAKAVRSKTDGDNKP